MKRIFPPESFIDEQENSKCELKVRENPSGDYETKVREAIKDDYELKIKKLQIQHEKELNETIQKYESLIIQKDAIIENIKVQYDELMNVAQRYKDEAAKWYSMIYRRKN